jgi:hypothetical protein
MRRSVVPVAGATRVNEIADIFGKRMMALTRFGRLMPEPSFFPSWSDASIAVSPAAIAEIDDATTATAVRYGGGRPRYRKGERSGCDLGRRSSGRDLTALSWNFLLASSGFASESPKGLGLRAGDLVITIVERHRPREPQPVREICDHGLDRECLQDLLAGNLLGECWVSKRLEANEARYQNARNWDIRLRQNCLRLGAGSVTMFVLGVGFATGGSS